MSVDAASALLWCNLVYFCFLATYGGTRLSSSTGETEAELSQQALNAGDRVTGPTPGPPLGFLTFFSLMGSQEEPDPDLTVLPSGSYGSY